MNTTVAPLRPIGDLAGPAGSRWSGNLGAFESDRLGFMLRARAEFGGLVKFDALTTIVNDAQVAAHILLDREHIHAVRENFLGEAITEDRIAETRKLRPNLNPGMRRARAAQVPALVVPRLEAELQNLVGQCLDPLPMLERTAAWSIATYYFGVDAPAVVAPIRDLLDALDVFFGSPFAMPASWPTPARLRISKKHRRLQAVVLPLLRLRAPGLASSGQDLATGVVQAFAHEGGPPIERIGQMVIGSLLAAQRVPGAAAAWMLLEVSRQDVLQNQLVADEAERFARAASGEGVSIRDYPLASAIVLETLRLHPPTWLLHRTTLAETAVGGYAVPRGHNFLISPYVIHRDEGAFENPEHFQVGRWERSHGVASRCYIPFGRGPHACPGNEVAMSMMVAILLTVLRHCQVRPGAGRVIPNPRSTLLPSGLSLRFSRR